MYSSILKKNNGNKAYSYFAFILVSVVMLFTRYISFTSYNGTDDLHYAMLGSRLLNHTYHPFFLNDIYAGRVLLIAWQALWFRIFGINDFAVIMPSLFILILLAFIICFKSGLPLKPSLIATASALVYFNPVVADATLGCMPDIYIAIISCLIFIIIGKNILSPSTGNHITQGIATGLLLTCGLFIKETILFVYVATIITCLLFYKKIDKAFLISATASIITGCISYLLLFYIKTGNPFFRLQQIHSSAYFNACSYQCFSGWQMFKRLTVMVPIQFIEAAFFPVLLAFTFFIPVKKIISPAINFYRVAFIVITLTAIYFPVSITPYIPLCHEPRQFLFLMPVAVLLYINAWAGINSLTTKRFQFFLLLNIAILLLAVIVNCTLVLFNKWIIADETLLAAVFIFIILTGKKYIVALLFFLLPLVLWLSTAYSLYKKPNHGYAELKQLHGIVASKTSLQSNIYYFIDNDTKMHFELIDEFNDAATYISLDTSDVGLKTFRQYQPAGLLRDTIMFKPGWLVINPYYSTIDSSKIKNVFSLLKKPPVNINGVCADSIVSSLQLQKIIAIINPQKIITTDCSN